MRVVVRGNSGVRQRHRAAVPDALTGDLLQLFDRDGARLRFYVGDTLIALDVDAQDVWVCVCVQTF
jgi:hypothetical protein